MSEDAGVVDVRVLDLLLAEIVDTQEKLDVIACFRPSSGAMTTATISARTGLSWGLVAEVLRDLHLVGIVATANEDGAGWWVDDFSPWRDVISVLARVYETDRHLLLRRISKVALHRYRGIGRTDVPHVIRHRLKHEP